MRLRVAFGCVGHQTLGRPTNSARDMGGCLTAELLTKLRRTGASAARSEAAEAPAPQSRRPDGSATGSHTRTRAPPDGACSIPTVPW